MSYSVKIERFEGPLDLLLQLVESEKLEITEVSLMAVTEPFIAHVRERQGSIAPEELADFLTIAAKLVYLKSKALLPDLYDEEMEEGTDLETQLRLYKSFIEAAKDIEQMYAGNNVMFGRKRRMKLEREAAFRPPEEVTASLLAETLEGIIRRLMPFMQLPKAAITRAVTIEEKIQQLRTKITSRMQVSFHQFLSKAETKQEAVVSFLALLELIKQRIVRIEQKNLFEDITIHSAS